MNSEPPSNEFQPLAKRLIHDLRNHLNGVSMETAFLEEVLQDQEATVSVRQIRKEIQLIERDLRAFAIRLATPEKEIVPALDTFQLWQSSGQNLTSGGGGTWHCNLNSELIHIDMRMIAIALCELLPVTDRVPWNAAAGRDEHGVIFEVRRCAKPTPLDLLLPGFEKVITANGGDFMSSIDLEKDEFLFACRFPLASP